MSASFSEALASRAEALCVRVPPDVVPAFETYFRLLARWNRTVNLTSLPVETLGAEAIDRLLLEPVSAAPFFPAGALTWVDLGSGGGSPAIPLKLLRPEADLAMVEARSRKVAFLREAIRELGLSSARAEEFRFESLLGAAEWTGVAGVITARAVRADGGFLQLVRQMLRSGGELLLFEGTTASIVSAPGFGFAGTQRLLNSDATCLNVYRRG